MILFHHTPTNDKIENVNERTTHDCLQPNYKPCIFSTYVVVVAASVVLSYSRSWSKKITIIHIICTSRWKIAVCAQIVQFHCNRIEFLNQLWVSARAQPYSATPHVWVWGWHFRRRRQYTLDATWWCEAEAVNVKWSSSRTQSIRYRESSAFTSKQWMNIN